MREIRIVKDPFRPWYWEAELKELDAASAEGWQLTARTGKAVEYEYDPAVRYRYAMDYRFGHREEQYLPFFIDAGWELVNWQGNAEDCFEGRWYFFRKVYDPELPEEEYQIATDEESQKAMLERFHAGSKSDRHGNRLYHLGVALPALCIWHLVDGFSIECILLILMTLISLPFEYYRKQCLFHLHPKKPNPRAYYRVLALTIVFVVLLFATSVVSSRANDYIYTKEASPAGTILSFEVYWPNLYTLSLRAGSFAETTVTLWDEDGAVLRTETGTQLSFRETMFLTPGTYYITTCHPANTDPSLHRYFTYKINVGWQLLSNSY